MLYPYTQLKIINSNYFCCEKGKKIEVDILQASLLCMTILSQQMKNLFLFSVSQ